jgi:hypothetical protein
VFEEEEAATCSKRETHQEGDLASWDEFVGEAYETEISGSGDKHTPSGLGAWTTSMRKATLV